MKEKEIHPLLTDLYKQARSQGLSKSEIEVGFKKFITERIDKYDRAVLNKTCGLGSTNIDMDRLALELVILFDRQYEQNKDDLISALEEDIEQKKEDEQESAFGFISIFLPFIIGGIIGEFLFKGFLYKADKSILSFISFGFGFYLPATALMVGGIVGFIVILLIETILLTYVWKDNVIFQYVFVYGPGIGLFIYQIIDYIIKKSKRKKAEKENNKNIDFIKNDYSNKNVQKRINEYDFKNL